MKPIKKVTLDSVDYFSHQLSTKTKKATKSEIQNQLISYIYTHGNNSFITLFNKAISTKKYDDVFEIIKL